MTRKSAVTRLVAFLWLGLAAQVFAQDRLSLGDGKLNFHLNGDGVNKITSLIPVDNCGALCKLAEGSASGTGNLQSSGTYTFATPSPSPFFLTANDDGTFTVTQTSPIQFNYTSSQGTLIAMADFTSVLSTDELSHSGLSGNLTIVGGSFAQYFPAGGDLDVTVGLTFRLQDLWQVHGFAAAEFQYASLTPTDYCQTQGSGPANLQAPIEVAGKVPLGQSLQSTANCFRVYVPDRWGGKLTIAVDGGTLKGITGPDGKPFTNGSDTGQDKQGWYTFQTEGGNKKVGNTFTQEGEAKTVPWNFFYFPFHVKTDKDKRARLYNDPGAYTKFDKKFNLGAMSFNWEKNNHKNDNRPEWEGHCWGSALASIIVQDPAPAKGTAFTQDELEGLSSEFFDKYGATNLLRSKLPLQKPQVGLDPTDQYVHKFHNGLREMLRTKHKPVHLNLRQESGKQDNEKDDQVWNQGCYKYSSKMMEDPTAAGDPLKEKPFQIEFDTTFICNDDFLTPADDNGVSTGNPKTYPKGRREQESTYILMYANDGEIKPNEPVAGRKQNWLTMQLKHSFRQGDTNVVLFVPRTMFDVTPAASKYTDENQGKNPYVRADRLDKLDIKKNDGF